MVKDRWYLREELARELFEKRSKSFKNGEKWDEVFLVRRKYYRHKAEKILQQREEET